MPKKIFIYIGLVALVSAVGASAFGEKPLSPASNSPLGQSGLEVRISNTQSEYILGEPVVIETILVNPNPEPLRWRKVLGLGRDVNLQSRDMSGQIRRWEGQQIVALIKTKWQEIAPRAELTGKLLVDQSMLTQLFPNPGRYELNAELVYKKMAAEGEETQARAVSNSVFVEIKELSGVNQAAYGFLNGQLDTAMKQPDVRALAQSQQEFVDRFGTSVYAKYVILQLARTYNTLGEHRKAAREVCKLRDVDFYFSKEVEAKTYELEAKLRPFVLVELPEGAPEPPRPHPCTRMLN